MTAQELKNSILHLAVQGKLVPQDPNDESASVLLEKIKVDREKLIKEKKIKKEKYSEIYKDDSNNHYYEKFEDGTINDITEEIPFDIPSSWLWCRLSSLTKIISGYAFKGSDLKASKNIRVIRISDYDENGLKNNNIVKIEEKSQYDNFTINDNSILIAMTGGTVGKSILLKSINEKMYLNQRVALIGQIFKNITIDYINVNILSPITKKIINDNKNSTNDNISMELINNFLIALPPEKEQIRIISKLESILTYI
jgi:type I restriction enzyme S subunit